MIGDQSSVYQLVNCSLHRIRLISTQKITQEKQLSTRCTHCIMLCVLNSYQNEFTLDRLTSDFIKMAAIESNTCGVSEIDLNDASDSESTSQQDDGQYLFDFTKDGDVDVWQEQSDTVRDVGMSKAVFVIHKNVGFRRAIFFALLNPQLNGAGFAGIRAIQTYNLTGYTKLQIKCRGQGQFNGFKVTLRHKGLNDEPNYSFEQYFQAPKDDFAIRNLKFSEFKAYYRGKRVNNNEQLDLSQVSSIGIQMYGGVYQPVKQKGPATLEIDWIRAV